MIEARIEQSIYQEIIDGMMTREPWGAPQGKFYELSPENTVARSDNPTIIQLETDRLDEVINIEVLKTDNKDLGSRNNKRPSTITYVPRSRISTIPIHLGEGKNSIVFRTRSLPTEVTYITVFVNSIVSVWEAFARDYFTNVERPINEERRAIFSPFGTRLVEPFLPIQDLIPDTQSLKVLSTRLAMRGYLHNVGTKSGQEDIIKAVTLGTPAYNKMDKRTFNFDPGLDPWYDAASQIAGKEAHCWIPNVGILAWTVFWKTLAANPKNYELISVSEDTVIFEHQGRIKRHDFNFDSYGTDFLAARAREECFSSILVDIFFKSNLRIKTCAASYTFDLVLENPIGDSRASFDLDIPFDQGLPFDQDPVDPFGDGWLGLSLTGRFEQYENNQLALDTFVSPSSSYTGDDCVYQGFYNQHLNNNKQTIDLEVEFTSSGEMTVNNPPPPPSQELLVNTTFMNNAVDGSKFSALIFTSATDSQGNVYVGGDFTDYNGNIGHSKLAKFDSNGNLDTTFMNNAVSSDRFNNRVHSISIDSLDNVYVSGNFSSYGGTAGRSYLVKFDSNGNLDTTFVANAVDGSKFNSRVNTVAVDSLNNVYAGGNFQNYNGVGRNSLAKFDSNGNLDTTFMNNAVDGGMFNALVENISVDPSDNIYVGGDFNDYGGTTGDDKLAKFDSNGNLDNTFMNNAVSGSKFDRKVEDIDFDSLGSIYVGGEFQSYNSTSGSRLAKFDSNGNLDTTFMNNAVNNGAFNSFIWDIAVDSLDNVYIGGFFTDYGGVTGRSYLVKFDSDGILDTTFVNNIVDGSKFSSLVLSVDIDINDGLYVGGLFTNYEIAGRDYFLALSNQ